MKNIQFLAIGDVVVDAFIELLDAHVNCEINHDNCTISMRFGDKIPYKDVVVTDGVGNSPNASVSASRLGLNTTIITHVGDDQYGKDCIQSLSQNGVDTSLVQINPGMKTNYHFVLSFDAERTILIKHEDYPYDFEKEMLSVPTPEWIYFSSVGKNSIPYHEQIAQYLEKNPQIKFAFQPNTFQILLGPVKLKTMYEQAELFFCNKEESQRILSINEDDIKVLLQKMKELGPKIVCITDGPNGAYVFDGEKMYFMPIYPDPKPPVERTGAGDAFSSTFTSLIASGMSVTDALLRAPINSMNVVQHIGAQKGLLTRDEIESWLVKAPEDYQVKEI